MSSGNDYDWLSSSVFLEDVGLILSNSLVATLASVLEALLWKVNQDSPHQYEALLWQILPCFGLCYGCRFHLYLWSIALP